MENYSHGGFGNLFIKVNTLDVNHPQNTNCEMGIARYEYKRPSPSLDNLFSNRDVLAKRLKNRPAKEDLVDRHIIPAHSAVPSIYDRITLLERKKTGDFLQKKIRARPSRQQLIQRHILADRCVDASLYENIGKLERQKIADQLNEHLLARPGPIELIQDRILPVESPIQNVIENATFEATLSPTSSTLDTPSVSELENNLDCTSPSPPLISDSPFTDTYRNPCSNLTDKLFRQVSEPNIGKLTISQNFSLSQKENEKLVRSIGKKTKASKPRIKKLKFHECRPPDMPVDLTIANPVDERYQQLLEQQTLYLRLQVMQQNAVLNALNGNTNSIDSVTEEIENIIKKDKKTVSPDLKSIKGQKLDELRVIDLRAHLKHRGLLVSGPKAKLIQRLVAFEEGKSSPSDFSYSSSMNENPLVTSPTAVTSVVTPTTVMQVTTYATDTNTGQTYQVVQTVPSHNTMQYQNSLSPIHMDHVNIQPVIAVTQPHVMTIQESISTTKINTSNHLSSQSIQYQMTTPPQQPSPTFMLHQDLPVQRASLLQHDKLKTEVQHLTGYSPPQCFGQEKLSQSLPAVPFNSTYFRNDTSIDLNHQHKNVNANERTVLSASNSLDLQQYRVRTSSEPQDQYKRSYSYNDSNQYQLQNGVDKNANIMEVNKLLVSQFTKSAFQQHPGNQVGTSVLKSQENYDEIMDILGELSTPSPSNTVSPPNSLQIKVENPPPYISCVFSKQQEQPRNQFSNKFLSLSNTKQFSSVPENMNTLGSSPSQNCPSTPYGSLGGSSHSGSMSNLQIQQSNSFGTLNQSSSTGNIMQRSDSHQSLTNGSYRNTNTPTNYLKMEYNPPMSPMSIGDDNLNMELEQLTSNQNQALSWLDLNIDSSLQFPTFGTKNFNTSESYPGLSNASGMLEMNSSMIPQHNLYGSNTRNQTSIYGSSPQPNDGFVSLFELEGGGY